MISNPLILNMLVLFIVISILLYKYFLKEGGIILEMNGIFPRKKGNRDKASKWAPYVQYLGLAAMLFWLLDFYVKFFQQEAEIIQQRIGGL